MKTRSQAQRPRLPILALILHPPFKDTPSSLAIFDETLEDVPEEAKIEKAKQLEEAARSVDPARIKKVRKASYHEILSRKTLVNSNGLRFSYAATFVSVSVTVVAETSEESEVGWDFDYSHFLNDLDVEKRGPVRREKGAGEAGWKEDSFREFTPFSFITAWLPNSSPLWPIPFWQNRSIRENRR